MDITAETVFKHNPERTWRKYLKGVVVEPGIALNESATEIFTRVDGKKTFAQICQEVADVFDIDLATSTADTAELLADLKEQGIVDVA